jgi:hypothetical protein
VTAIERICASCGTKFILSEAEVKVFAELAKKYPNKSIVLPLRCTTCRWRRRREPQRSPRDWRAPEA